ncbi:MAG: hypothetical protein ERJ67_06725 [Aphanocapsa feldmannii 277cV]|uniref:Uncharacterized protein n=1 Tax=Aphanocapsa feldmannii 277cV TaxID=2507553 RepID=A0A524RN13_9CHRO|nr:MAG: hypothetical protein ERJ67_06725 [Aphanocapsa feldmannii 277cV]
MLRLLASCSATDQARASYQNGLMLWAMNIDVIQRRTLQAKYPAWGKAMSEQFAEIARLDREGLTAALAFELVYACPTTTTWWQ